MLNIALVVKKKPSITHFKNHAHSAGIVSFVVALRRSIWYANLKTGETAMVWN